MANFCFNVALGRIVELHNRVDSSDPTNAALIVVPIDAGAASDATLKDLDTLTDVLAAVTERTTGGWNRKTLTDTDLSAITPDDTNDRFDVDIPDQTWTGVSAGAVTDLVICYDADSTGGTDATVLPLAQFDFVIAPDGSDVTAVVNAAGYFRAT